MDKSAVFVDAGYLLARGGLVVCGTHRRAEFDCSYKPLIAALTAMAAEHCELQALRLYWYDGAPDRIPTSDHLTIGNLPYVKVRLGRIGQDGRQKGVDALIYRDLMTLARERAISRAYLLSGDEDLREGVVAAQDLGVQVVVVGLAHTGSSSTSQSRDLVREADEHIVLRPDFLEPFFTLPDASSDSKLVDQHAVTAAGSELGSQWAANATQSEIQAILEQDSLPRGIDSQLLRDASRSLDVSRIPDELVRHLRDAFRSSVEHVLEASDAGAISGA
jgi:uncharacterized LabA/DUF88 family protein